MGRNNTSRYAWFVVLLLWFVCFFNYADRQAIFSVFPLLKTEFGLTDVQLGVLASSFMWMYALIGPVGGWVTDRVSRTYTIISALSFWSLITAATVLAHTYRTLILLRAFAGLGEAFYLPAAVSLIAAYHGPATRSRALSVHQSSVYIGTVVGGSLSAYLAERSGWRASFSVLGAGGLVLALVLASFLRDPEKEPQAGSTLEDKLDPRRESSFVINLTTLAKSRPVLLLIAVFIGANFVAVIFLTWMPTFLQRKFSMTLASAAFNSTAYIQGASVVGVVAGGFLADAACKRWGRGRQLVQAGGLLAGTPFLFFTGHASTLRVLAVSMIGFGLFKGIYDSNIWASLYDFVGPRQRGLATGCMNSLGWLGAGFAPIAVATATRHSSMSVSLSASAAIYLALGTVLAGMSLSWLKNASSTPVSSAIETD